MSSNREKRKIAREGAQKLKGTDWDPTGFVAKSPIERLQELAAQEAFDLRRTRGRVGAAGR